MVEVFRFVLVWLLTITIELNGLGDKVSSY
jgi:hypothetical protein